MSFSLATAKKGRTKSAWNFIKYLSKFAKVLLPSQGRYDKLYHQDTVSDQSL